MKPRLSFSFKPMSDDLLSQKSPETSLDADVLATLAEVHNSSLDSVRQRPNRPLTSSALHVVAIYGDANKVKALANNPDYYTREKAWFKDINAFFTGDFGGFLRQRGVAQTLIDKAMETDMNGSPEAFAAFFNNKAALDELVQCRVVAGYMQMAAESTESKSPSRCCLQ